MIKSAWQLILKKLKTRKSKKQKNNKMTIRIKHYISKANLKRCVLSTDLKRSKLSTRRIWRGRLFHKVGAADEKARSPKVFFSLSIPVYAHYLQKGGKPFVRSTAVMLVMVVYQLGCMDFCSFVVWKAEMVNRVIFQTWPYRDSNPVNPKREVLGAPTSAAGAGFWQGPEACSQVKILRCVFKMPFPCTK